MVLVLLVAAALGGTGWMVLRSLEHPGLEIAPVTPEDGLRAQQKIYEVLRGGSQRVQRAEAVTLTEREMNAFLARHLGEAAELPLAAIGVRLVGDGIIEFAGRLPARHVVSEPPLSAVSDLLPARWLARPVWLHLRAHVVLEPGALKGERRYLRVTVTRFALGRQRLPVALLRVLLNPTSARLLRWRLPDTVEAVTIAPGRALIRVGGSR